MTDTIEAVKPCTRGCVKVDGKTPFPATHGAYCSRCWGRLDTALGHAGELAQHLIGNALTTSGGAAEGRVDSSREAPVPFNQAAFDDANELYSALVYWSVVWAGHLQTSPPGTARRAWRTETGKIVGLPAGTSSEDAHSLVGGMATWLKIRLDAILTTDHPDDVDAMTDAMADVWRMNARWPRVQRPDYSAMPCPHDECKKRIAVYPPTFKGDSRRVVCTAGHWFPEEEYEHLILVFQDEAKEQARTNRTAARLAKKYGGLMLATTEAPNLENRSQA